MKRERATTDAFFTRYTESGNKRQKASISQSEVILISDDEEEAPPQQEQKLSNEADQPVINAFVDHCDDDRPLRITIEERSTRRSKVFLVSQANCTQLELKKLVLSHFGQKMRASRTEISDQYVAKRVRLVSRGNFLLDNDQKLSDLDLGVNDENCCKMYLLWNDKVSYEEDIDCKSSMMDDAVVGNNKKMQDEDDDLEMIEEQQIKRAIELSLQSSASSHETTAESKMASNKGKEPDTSDQNHSSGMKFNGEKIFLNRLVGSKRAGENDTLSIGDLIERDRLEAAFISTFSFDLDYFAEVFGLANRMIPVTLVKHWDKNSKSEEEGRSMFQVGESPMVVIHPPLPQKYSNMHSKLWLLSFPNCLRVVVSSANMCHVDWHSYTQVIWVQDFPKRKSNSQVNCDFREELVNFWNIATLRLPAKWLDQYDFRSAKAQLVCSVPGYHSGSNLKKYGHMRIRDVLKQGVFSTAERSPHASCFFQASSIGALDMKWLGEIGTSCFIHVPSNKTQSGLKIVFPSETTVARSKLGTLGAGMIILRKDAYLSPNFPKHLLCDYKSCQASQDGYLAHSKIFVYCDSNGSALWMYAGSHNFSGAALGRLQKKNNQLSVSNYEVGVILLTDSAQTNQRKLPFQVPVSPYESSTTRPHLFEH